MLHARFGDVDPKTSPSDEPNRTLLCNPCTARISQGGECLTVWGATRQLFQKNSKPTGICGRSCLRFAAIDLGEPQFRMVNRQTLILWPGECGGNSRVFWLTSGKLAQELGSMPMHQRHLTAGATFQSVPPSVPYFRAHQVECLMRYEREERATSVLPINTVKPAGLSQYRKGAKR